MENTSKMVVDIESPAYELGLADCTAERESVEMFATVMTVAIADGKAAYNQARLDYTAGRIAAGDDDGYARTRFYRQLKNAGLAAPGKQGKRKPKAEPPAVDTSREAWLLAYDAADWTMARRIMTRLIADAK